VALLALQLHFSPLSTLRNSKNTYPVRYDHPLCATIAALSESRPSDWAFTVFTALFFLLLHLPRFLNNFQCCLVTLRVRVFPQ